MEQLIVRSHTDTAHPQASVPIYAIHTMQNPLCSHPDCWCQTNKEQVAQLLEALNNGTLLLDEAASFAERNQA